MRLRKKPCSRYYYIEVPKVASKGWLVFPIEVASEHVKNFCYNVSCRTAPVRALDFTRIEFGWIFGLYDYIGPDVAHCRMAIPHSEIGNAMRGGLQKRNRMSHSV